MQNALRFAMKFKDSVITFSPLHILLCLSNRVYIFPSSSCGFLLDKREERYEYITKMLHWTILINFNHWPFLLPTPKEHIIYLFRIYHWCHADFISLISLIVNIFIWLLYVLLLVKRWFYLIISVQFKLY